MTARALVASLAFTGVSLQPATAAAQIDPLLFLKEARPTVLVALDVSSRMQRDLSGAYLDPFVYPATGDAWETALGVTGANTSSFYRRRYTGLAWLDPGGPRASVAAIEIVGDRQEGFPGFDGQSRMSIARAALGRAIDGNRLSARFGLLAGRRIRPRFELHPPATVLLRAADPAAPTDAGVSGTWNAVLGVAEAAAAPPESAVLVPADAAGSNEAILDRLSRPPLEEGALVPAGPDDSRGEAAPVLQLLDDLRIEAARLIAADASCRNIVALLLTGGGQQPASEGDLASRAAGFVAVEGRRVPLYVVALAPSPPEADSLRRLAEGTGGRYVEIPARPPAAPDGGTVVTAVTAAANAAVQHAFARYADVNAPPTPAQPLGPLSEFPTAPPVVGTVDLENAVAADGVVLPLTRVTTPAGAVIPQQSNVLFTAGFALPGFEGRVRAFRVYRPQPDPAGPGGYRFVADGTPIWTASAPPPGARNMFAVLPGRGLVPFDIGQLPLLAPFLRSADPAALVAAIRAHPLGAATSSTPALLTPPALPGGDEASRAFVEDHRERRAVLFVGLDDGMMHAFDGRTGLEVWAVIPFNLLPKLRFLLDGQPVDDFRHYVGGSPRLADALVGGSWRTLLVFGEGAGGTFYQAFDVTLDGIGLAVPPATDRRLDLLGWFADPRRIPFLWSHPSYAHFDPSIGPEGDVSAEATEAEKSVGQSWSTPAILGLRAAVPSLVLVGSGPLPASAERRDNRGGTAAGRRVYLLDAGTGVLLDSHDAGSDGEGEGLDGCPAAGCTRFKNALAGDPVVLSAVSQPTRAYMGDLDGRLWRFTVGEGGPARLADARVIFSAGAAQPLFGAVATVKAGAGATYLFLGTGGDQLAMDAGHPAANVFTLLETAGGVTRVGELTLEAPSGGGRDERLSALPALGGEAVFFSTTASAPSGCQAAESRVYALTVSGTSAYDTTGDGRRDARDSQRIAAVAAGRATPPAVADRHLFVVAGDRLQVFGDPSGFNAGPGFVGIRVLSWREVGRAPRP